MEWRKKHGGRFATLIRKDCCMNTPCDGQAKIYSIHQVDFDELGQMLRVAVPLSS